MPRADLLLRWSIVEFCVCVLFQRLPAVLSRIGIIMASPLVRQVAHSIRRRAVQCCQPKPNKNCIAKRIASCMSRGLFLFPSETYTGCNWGILWLLYMSMLHLCGAWLSLQLTPLSSYYWIISSFFKRCMLYGIKANVHSFTIFIGKWCNFNLFIPPLISRNIELMINHNLLVRTHIMSSNLIFWVISAYIYGEFNFLKIEDFFFIYK